MKLTKPICIYIVHHLRTTKCRAIALVELVGLELNEIQMRQGHSAEVDPVYPPEALACPLLPSCIMRSHLVGRHSVFQSHFVLTRMKIQLVLKTTSPSDPAGCAPNGRNSWLPREN
jgi:hypothetical protein